MRKITKIGIHHSVTPRDLPLKKSVESFNRTHAKRLHKTENALGLHIAYHRVFAGSGESQKTREDREIGYHASNWKINKASLGFCMTGNFDIETPSSAQLEEVKKWILIKCEKYHLGREDIFFHREIAGVYKSCPGKNIDKEKFLDFVFEKNPEYPKWAEPVFVLAEKKGVKTDLMKNTGDIPLYHLLAIILKILK